MLGPKVVTVLYIVQTIINLAIIVAILFLKSKVAIDKKIYDKLLIMAVIVLIISSLLHFLFMMYYLNS